jgi:hypothetical protein
MPRRSIVAAMMVLLGATTAQAKDTQFWNLTAEKIVKLQLSPAGKNTWGTNQTDNDPDGSVDPDERLKILGVVDGAYDIRFTDEKGRTCVVTNMSVSVGQRFAIKESQLTGCAR